MNISIKQYFDKGSFLTVKNKTYADACLELFDFQIKSDLAENDITSNIIEGKYKESRADIFAKQSGVVAGIEEVAYLLDKRTDLKIKQTVKDGSKINNKDLLVQLKGSPLEILRFERTIINILQRMSGIATMTNHLITKNHLKVRLASTRKTLWGLVDKKAVFIGGGLTHRLSLSDEILIKDNHIDLSAKKSGVSRLKSIENILNHIKEKRVEKPFEIEVESEKEAYFLSDQYQKSNISSPLIIMLDNFKPVDAKKTINVIRNQMKAFKIFFELSGGINEDNLKDYDQARADVISLGSLTHSSKALDLSLKFV
jgi:nicotinate-nucleotide pyrophosphorylase (carboxylating)